MTGRMDGWMESFISSRRPLLYVNLVIFWVQNSANLGEFTLEKPPKKQSQFLD
jgi:hypothetical protein